METLDELKAIRDNAPEGANYATKHYYLMVEGLHCKIFNSLGVWSAPVCNAADIFIDEKPRSLSDINRIIELMEWQEAAFEAHPNIDTDIDNVKFSVYGV